MNEKELYDNVCGPNFNRLEKKIDTILSSINGNGHPGIKTRVDRLEQRAITQSKLIWIVIVALIGSLANSILNQTLLKKETQERHEKLELIEYYPLE